MIDAETGLRGFYLTEEESKFLEPFDRADRVLPERFGALRQMIADNSRTVDARSTIESPNMPEWRAFWRGRCRRIRNLPHSPSAFGQPSGKDKMDQIRKTVDRFIVEEKTGSVPSGRRRT